MTARPVRVAHLVSHPIQYFAPLYRELATRPEVDLVVYFYSDATSGSYFDREFGRAVEWDVPLLEGYRSKIVRSARGREVGRRFDARPHFDLLRELARRRYDAVWVNGVSHATTWLARPVAAATGATFMLREEQTLLHPRAWPKAAAKAIALRALFAGAVGLYIGEQNRRYFRRYGVPEERLFATPYAVDNAFFRKRRAELEPRRAAIRAELGVAGAEPVVLFSGKLIEKKEPLVLLEAFARVRRRHPCRLLVVGDGPLRSQLERRARELGLADVVVAGFLNQTELPAAYVAADVFVLPSSLHETWGLVVNEALNFALPVVVTDKVGCAADLVRDGWNGFVVPPRDVDALGDAVERLVADADLRAQFGSRGDDIVSRYDIRRAADGVVAACTSAATRRMLSAETRAT